ncbi:STT3 domain-containing protein [Sulfurimonas sp. HSL-1656]|uniref:STT3 domain-containing protein n=1 Tax=Thiomicrolovo subterrani TaxID=3131934 RepID=UPI0031F9C20A
MSIKQIDFGSNRLGFIVILMSTAYLFSLLIRMIWVYQMGGVADFHWNGQLMINTNDGYYFGAAAQKALEGLHQFNPRLPDWLGSGVVFFTVLLTKYTPFSLDTVMLYLPAVVSSIVVVPIILIGRLYGSALLGFFAALIGSIAWSYYNRTMTGYYDTDMFSAMMPMFILYFLLATLETEKRIFMLLSALSIMIYPFLYDSGLSLIYAMGLLYMGYMVVFHRNDTFTWHSIILIAVALMGIPTVAKFVLIIGLYLLFSKTAFTQQKLMIAAGITVLLFLYTGNVFTLIWAKFSTYFYRGVDESGGLRFYEVAQTVREAGKIPFEMMANRISGSVAAVLAALAGYIVLVVRHRGFILALPLIGIGIFSLWGGLRFTVYAVPVAAISVVYLFYMLTFQLTNHWARYGVVAALTGLVLYPNITHILGYKVPTVFSVPEVQALDKLSKTGSPKDYVLTWWDYGYPIWFYGDKNTLIDGGKHNHDNFIVSQMVCSESQLEAARLGRLAVEAYVAADYKKPAADILFRNNQPDQVEPNAFLESLRYGDITLPESTRDIFVYLPLRMLDIFPTVCTFSNLDLNSGQRYSPPFLYVTSQFQEQQGMLLLGNGITLDQRRGIIRAGGQEVSLKAFYTASLSANGDVEVKSHLVKMDGTLSLIYMASYGRMLLIDDSVLNSNYIQMFVLGRYDPALFEPVEMSPYVKIFRVKN